MRQGPTIKQLVSRAALLSISVPVVASAQYTGSIQYPISLPAGFTANGLTVTNDLGQVAGYEGHALSVSSSGTGTDITPTGDNQAQVRAQYGGYEVGFGDNATTLNQDALLWHGASSSAVVLTPAGFSTSTAVGIFGNQIVGYADSTALIWNNFGGSFTNIEPSFGTHAIPLGTDGVNQVGYAGLGQYDPKTGWEIQHAVIWSGTAASAIDINPAGISDSYANAVSGNEEVGFAYNVSTGSQEAVVWHGSAASAVVINPANLTASVGNGTNGSQEVGYGWGTSTGNYDHALLWSGSANSAVDLQALLPKSGTWTFSTADSIDQNGDIFGVASGTVNGLTGQFAIEWAPPTSYVTVNVSSGQTYHFPANSGTGILITSIGGLAVNSSAVADIDGVANHSNRQLLVIIGGGLTLASVANNWTGLVNVNNNDIDIQGGVLSAATAQIRQGFAGGTWSSAGGITSSSAATDTTHLTTLGVIQNNQSGSALFTASNQFDGTTPGASDVLIKYTYFGDANLDGKVDGSDYSRIDTGYLNHASGWFNGDFNYDGVVDGSDYALIDNAFNTQGAHLNTQIAAVTVQISGQTPVPEPTGLGLIALNASVTLRRRRRLKGRD